MSHESLPFRVSVLSMIVALMLVLVLMGVSRAAAAADNPLPNAGFEGGEAEWEFKDAISHVVPEAARTGKQGIRIGSADGTKQGAQVFSSAFAVTPGQEVTASFWARADKGCGGVYLVFRDADNKWLKNSNISGGVAMVGVKGTGEQWAEYQVNSTAPDRAATVSVWLHTFGSTPGTIDIDDVVVSGLPADVVVISAAASKRPKAEVPVDPATIPKRDTPPVIILKLDDLKQHRGKVHPRWQAVADYLDQRRIKGSIGVICETLQEATPEYTAWINDHRDTGRWEFWFHGWDHLVHEENGTKYNEFNERSYEDQKKRFDDSQALAQEKLGFAFETFGPTGGTSNGMFNTATLQAVQDDPYIAAILYPSPMDNRGRTLEAQGKVQVLDRVWAVNLEGSVGSPDFNRFLKGYAANLDRPYFVLQGHPGAWSDSRFAEFEKIIDFLVERDAVFMTPIEYARIKASQ